MAASDTSQQSLSAEDDIKHGALQFGALACGIAAATAFEDDAPPGFRPRDLLPNARSVIVVGGAAPRAGEWLSPSIDTMTTTSTADRINGVARRLAQDIENAMATMPWWSPQGHGVAISPM